MRVRLPTEHHLQEMAGIMGKPVDIRIVALQPAGQEIDRERETVHFGKQRHQKCAERAERPPVSGRAWFEKAVCEQYEDNRVDDDEAPKSVGWHIGTHDVALSL